jgi:hypothetical protein
MGLSSLIRILFYFPIYNMKCTKQGLANPCFILFQAVSFLPDLSGTVMVAPPGRNNPIPKTQLMEILDIRSIRSIPHLHCSCVPLSSAASYRNGSFSQDIVSPDVGKNLAAASWSVVFIVGDSKTAEMSSIDVR